MCPHGRAHWHHLANTIEPSVCGGDAVLRQTISTTPVNYQQVKTKYQFVQIENDARVGVKTAILQ